MEAGTTIAAVKHNKTLDVTSGAQGTKATLQLWRDTFTVKQAKEESKERTSDQNKDKFTVGELCSGGCLDTLAAMRAGFQPVFSSEIDCNQARMFEQLTGGECLGDTFGERMKGAPKVHYVKSGQPCTDWACSGKTLGESGETGWMFVKQTEVLLRLRPNAFRLEMSDNLPKVDGGEALRKVIDALSVYYVIYLRTIEVWRMGDPSNRKRVFVVGFDKKLGQATREFEWPKPSFTEVSVPTGRCIAVPDEEVPDGYWRMDKVIEQDHWDNQGRADKIQVIARQGKGMGYAKLPNVIRSWDGLLNGPTTLGGGGRGTELNWQSGQPIRRTRMTTPTEYQRAASLPSDYIEWCSAYSPENNDRFVLTCINNGVPLRTSVSIDTQVLKVLTRAHNRRKNPTELMANLTWQHKAVRKMLFDTGANGSINFRDVEDWLEEATASNMKITVANKACMEVGMDGFLPMSVINTAGNSNAYPTTNISIPTTTAESALELFAFDPLYRTGWGLHCRPSSHMQGKSEIYRPADEHNRAVSIPLRYDHTSNRGGFWVDYLIIKDPKAEHKRLLEAYHTDISEICCVENVNKIKYFDIKECHAMLNETAKRTDVIDILVGQHDADRQLRGVKLGLKTEKQKMTEQEFHNHHGHLGCSTDCKVCRMVKGAARRIYRKVDSHKETRAAYKFHLDTITWSDRSRLGNKYTSTMRCEGSDVFKAFNHYLRDDIVDLIDAWVPVLRADPAYHGCDYKIVAVICLDNAGEWALDTKKWKGVLEKWGITPIYSCPDNKKSAANAERAVGIIEIVTKALLMQNNLPPYWWEDCVNSAEFLLNRFPTTTMAATNSIDGDRVRPLELYSRFFYSRRQIDRELSYYLAPGTPALVQTTAKGSVVGPKTRWGIAIGMYRDQVIFMCPHVQSEFRSKSFAAFRLKDGLNYLQFLGLPEVETSRRSLAIPADFKEKVVVQLTDCNNNKTKKRERPITSVILGGNMTLNPPVIEITEDGTPGKLGGSVQVTDTSGEQFEVGAESNPDSCAQADEVAGSVAKKAKSKAANTYTGQLYIDCGVTAEVKAKFDKADADRAQGRGVDTTGAESFVRICKKMDLQFDEHETYRTWLKAKCGLKDEQLPTKSYTKLNAGMHLPYPTGYMWRDMVVKGSRKKRRALHLDFDVNEDAVEAAEDWLTRKLEEQNQQVASGGRYTFNIEVDLKAIQEKLETRRPSREIQANAIKKRRSKAVATGVKPPPKTARNAMQGEDAMKWVASMNNEFEGLVELGVFELGFTAQGLLDEGIDLNITPAVPCGTYFENKFGVDGALTKHKSRIAIQGHPGNMQKGVHYSETFSATPKEYTARIICALVVLLNLTRRAFDITKAYCWADLPKGEMIALRYPDGFKKYHSVTGEELYMILRKNLYGHPAAGRTFSKARNKEIMRRFNQEGWTCRRCRSDPCLFVISKIYTIEGTETTKFAFMLAHVDDCDIAGQGDKLTDEIVAVCADIWKITIVDPEFMLGIRRRVTLNPQGEVDTCECTMVAFIEGMYESFKEYMPIKKPNGPVPDKLFLSKGDTLAEGEAKRVLDRGYMCAVGMLLWPVRHCYPIGKAGVSMLCRVMATPSEKAWEAAMQMIAYLYHNRHEGIKFSKAGNKMPIGFVDASNKPDQYVDGRAQWGDVFIFMGGPICEQSKKLKHVGLSSEHNEYMAMYYANQHLVWIRQLLEEMGLKNLIKEPTIMFADNKAANALSKEDIVSQGNQYIYLTYHFNKEVQELGFCKVEYIATDDNISDTMTKAVETVVRKRLQGPLSGYDLRLIQRLEKRVVEIHQDAPWD